MDKKGQIEKSALKLFSKTRFLVFLLLYIFSVNISFASCLPYPIVENDTLIKDCKPYRAIGVNYFDAFYRVLKNPKDKSYKEGFKKLGQAGIPFVRMMAGGFWPRDWELYFKDKENYFKLLDEVIKTAEENKVGIIMSLFWNISSVPDLVGEPISAWGDLNSKTIQFMKTYTREVVSRYKDSPAIWGWEFGNEYNLIADLPKGYQKVAPQYGTPSQRTEKDKLSWKDLINAFIQFADTVREIDKKRLISTGNSFPRPSSYHLAFYGSWNTDNLSQFLYFINLINPLSYDVVSVHIYPTHLGSYFSDVKIDNFDTLIHFAVSSSKKFNRVLFIGEFGVCREEKHLIKEEKEVFKEIISAIINQKVPLSALWVFDRQKEGDKCNVTFENDRSYQLQEIMKLNKNISQN